MKTKTTKVLTVLKVLAWMAFIGYLVRCGASYFRLAIASLTPRQQEIFIEHRYRYTKCTSTINSTLFISCLF